MIKGEIDGVQGHRFIIGCGNASWTARCIFVCGILMCIVSSIGFTLWRLWTILIEFHVLHTSDLFSFLFFSSCCSRNFDYCSNCDVRIVCLRRVGVSPLCPEFGWTLIHSI